MVEVGVVVAGWGGVIENATWRGYSGWVIWICGYLQPGQIPMAGTHSAGLLRRSSLPGERPKPRAVMNVQQCAVSCRGGGGISIGVCQYIPTVPSTAGASLTDGPTMSLWAQNLCGLSAEVNCLLFIRLGCKLRAIREVKTTNTSVMHGHVWDDLPGVTHIHTPLKNPTLWYKTCSSKVKSNWQSVNGYVMSFMAFLSLKKHSCCDVIGIILASDFVTGSRSKKTGRGGV